MLSDGELITIGEASRILKVSEVTVRRLEASGELQARRTSTRVRIFERAVVERVAQERAQKLEHRGR